MTLGFWFQTLLGHVNVETTRDCYLEPVSGLQVDLFLNDNVAEDASIADFITHIAAAAPESSTRRAVSGGLA